MSKSLQGRLTMSTTRELLAVTRYCTIMKTDMSKARSWTSHGECLVTDLASGAWNRRLPWAAEHIATDVTGTHSSFISDFNHSHQPAAS